MDNSLDDMMVDLMDSVRSATNYKGALSITDARDVLNSVADSVVAITVNSATSSDISGVYLLNKDTNTWHMLNSN